MSMNTILQGVQPAAAAAAGRCSKEARKRRGRVPAQTPQTPFNTQPNRRQTHRKVAFEAILCSLEVPAAQDDRRHAFNGAG